jgi:hypothetical protein
MSAPEDGRQRRAEQAREVSTAMTTFDRIRSHRLAKRQDRAIERAWHSAPTQAMRDEIAIFAQRRGI